MVRTKKQSKKLSKSDGDNGEKLVDFKFKYLRASSVRNPDILRSFIVWRSLYKQFRNPHTQDEFAKQHGVGINTLTRWTFLEGFWISYEKASLEIPPSFGPMTISFESDFNSLISIIWCLK